MTQEQTMTQLIPAIRTILARQGYNGEITPESNLFHLGLDSIGVMELLMEIENRFQIVFQDDDLQPELFEAVSRLTTLVQDKCAAATPQ